MQTNVELAVIPEVDETLIVCEPGVVTAVEPVVPVLAVNGVPLAVNVSGPDPVIVVIVAVVLLVVSISDLPAPCVPRPVTFAAIVTEVLPAVPPLEMTPVNAACGPLTIISSPSQPSSPPPFDPP